MDEAFSPCATHRTKLVFSCTHTRLPLWFHVPTESSSEHLHIAPDLYHVHVHVTYLNFAAQYCMCMYMSCHKYNHMHKSQQCTVTYKCSAICKTTHMYTQCTYNCVTIVAHCRHKHFKHLGDNLQLPSNASCTLQLLGLFVKMHNFVAHLLYPCIL